MKVDVKILGLFSLKTEDMPFWQLLILILIGAAVVIVIIYWLKLYAIPVLGTQGVLSLANMLKARSP